MPFGRPIDKEVIFWGLLLFILFSPFSISFTYIIWVVTAGLMFYVYLIARKERWEKTPLDTPLVTLVGASALSVVTSIDFFASLKEFRSLALIIIYYLFALNVDKAWKVEKLVSRLILVSAIAGAYGISQSITRWDLFDHFQGRSTGFFSLYLTYAEYLIVVISLTLGLFIYSKGVRRKIYFTIALAVMFGGLVVSYSRGPWIGLLCSVLLLAGMKGKRVLLITILVLVSLNLSLFYLNLGRSSVMVRSIFRLHPDGEPSSLLPYLQSNKERLLMWRSGFQILSDNPRYLVSGIGMHALQKIYPEYRSPEAQHQNLWHLHNNFMQILVTRGLLGLTAFLWIFLVWWKRIWRGFRDSPPGIEKGVLAGSLAGVAGFLVSGLTEYSWGDTEVLMLLYCILGITIAIARRNLAR
ncbi:hypothetical protein CEE39_03695 [bacterium (candidate division B38) B3_B38]|nr:MAG: hypothetical protein CEE39_03695 [bacterium (candidate division B38) B3_B38]